MQNIQKFGLAYPPGLDAVRTLHHVHSEQKAIAPIRRRRPMAVQPGPRNVRSEGVVLDCNEQSGFR
jgi:hypothetical protein